MKNDAKMIQIHHLHSPYHHSAIISSHSPTIIKIILMPAVNIHAIGEQHIYSELCVGHANTNRLCLYIYYSNRASCVYVKHTSHKPSRRHNAPHTPQTPFSKTIMHHRYPSSLALNATIQSNFILTPAPMYASPSNIHAYIQTRMRREPIHFRFDSINLIIYILLFRHRVCSSRATIVSVPRVRRDSRTAHSI